MKTDDFDYALPPELIAQTPLEPRDRAGLMVLNRDDNSLQHRRFHEVSDYLRDGDLLVLNNSRVIPARLLGGKVNSGGRLEMLLLRRVDPNVWETLVRPAKRIPVGTRIEISGELTSEGGDGCSAIAEVIGAGERGIRVVEFSDETMLPQLGKIALPPYIKRPLKDPERYQTVYADVDGSVAAPTAGLHFTLELMEKIRQRGIRCLFVTLHVGLDTFRPVREEDPQRHPIHREYGVVSQEVASQLAHARQEGRRIICVGTTTVRLIEAMAQASNRDQIAAFSGWVDLFIVPGYRFRVVDAMITNFHLPRTTLLMLVSAFAGKDLLDEAYRQAITRQYRFYSFGDAMLIL